MGFEQAIFFGCGGTGCAKIEPVVAGGRIMRGQRERVRKVSGTLSLPNRSNQSDSCDSSCDLMRKRHPEPGAVQLL